VSVPATSSPISRQTFAGDGAVVPRDGADGDVEGSELGDRSAGVRLGRVGEPHESHKREVALVLGGQGGGALRRAGGYGDDTVTVREVRRPSPVPRRGGQGSAKAPARARPCRPLKGRYRPGPREPTCGNAKTPVPMMDPATIAIAVASPTRLTKPVPLPLEATRVVRQPRVTGATSFEMRCFVPLVRACDRSTGQTSRGPVIAHPSASTVGGGGWQGDRDVARWRATRRVRKLTAEHPC